MTTRTKVISGELLKLKEEIHQYALDYGLDFYPVVFEVCDYDTINILAAQGGFPARYPHWRFGMEYDQLSKSYAYGLQKIYEMVVNTDPCYAYLLNANHLVDQKLVMAHVYGHADFFKNNLWFKGTNRNMMDVMANHGTKVRRYMEKYGQDSVETFIDCVLSLENLLDINTLFETRDIQHSRELKEREFGRQHFSHDDDDGRSTQLQSFMRSKLFDVQARGGQKKEEGVSGERPSEGGNSEGGGRREKSHSISPRDIMMYLVEYAPLEEWQADILAILREEAYYFLPQRMTKIINEGWASYWHSTIMTKKALKSSEIIEFADKHAGVMAMGRKNINPYKIGIELLRDIEYRWDTGRFGKEYNECTDMHERENWNRPTHRGKEKIFEVRKTHNDVTFIDEFFTQDFCERMQLFTYKYNAAAGRFEIESREFEEIKSKLLSGLTNFGQPIIEVLDGNYENRGELQLLHRHQGVDLDLKYASKTLQNIHLIWSRPVHLVTIQEGKSVRFLFDGKEFRILN